MEKSEYCFKESCLGEKKGKDDEISNLRNELAKLKTKLKYYQFKLRYTDLKKDFIARHLTEIPIKYAFDKLFCLVKSNIKKVHFWDSPTKSTKKGGTLKKVLKNLGQSEFYQKKTNSS